jgi:hypothetical protein
VAPRRLREKSRPAQHGNNDEAVHDECGVLVFQVSLGGSVGVELASWKAWPPVGCRSFARHVVLSNLAVVASVLNKGLHELSGCEIARCPLVLYPYYIEHRQGSGIRLDANGAPQTHLEYQLASTPHSSCTASSLFPC